MSILNIGSLNIDLVYRVPHIVRGGETIGSTSFQTFAGGKGANQSVALARAGAVVQHAGRVGRDGRWLVDKLAQAGVETSTIVIDDAAPTGHAIIQVDDVGENAIVLLPGANHRVTPEQVEHALAGFAGDVVLLQNEINDGDRVMRGAAAHGKRIAFNPAPMSAAVRSYPLELVDTLIVNETEACDLASAGEVTSAIETLRRKWPAMRIIVTRGARGAVFVDQNQRIDLPAARVDVVDTTAAGDTFIGYFLAAEADGLDARGALAMAIRAAGLCVTRPGAMDAIPQREALQ